MLIIIVLNVLIIFFVVLLFLWLYSNIICVDVIFSVKCNIVVISKIKGKMLKFIGFWVSIVIKIMMSERVILKLNKMLRRNGGMGRIIMFMIVSNIMGVFKLLVNCCSWFLLNCWR